MQISRQHGLWRGLSPQPDLEARKIIFCFCIVSESKGVHQMRFELVKKVLIVELGEGVIGYDFFTNFTIVAGGKMTFAKN